MDTEALWQAIAAYGNARWRGYSHEIDAEDNLYEIKAILNRSEAETRELLATNERLVDELEELKAAYESQFKELHELKAKLTEKASLLRGCYAADHKQKQRIEELTAERDALKAENERLLVYIRDCIAHYEDERAELERIKALEPVMVYHSACTIDCGEHGHHDTEMLKMIPAGTKLYARGRKA